MLIVKLGGVESPYLLNSPILFLLISIKATAIDFNCVNKDSSKEDEQLGQIISFLLAMFVSSIENEHPHLQEILILLIITTPLLILCSFKTIL